MASSKGTTTEWARVPPRTARPQTSTQCHTPRCRPSCNRCHIHLHKYHKEIHSSRIYNIHRSPTNRHLPSHMHKCNSRSRAQQQQQAGFSFPPRNPPSVDSLYFNNIPNTSQDVSFGTIHVSQFQPVDKSSTNPRDHPAAGDQ